MTMQTGGNGYDGNLDEDVVADDEANDADDDGGDIL